MPKYKNQQLHAKAPQKDQTTLVCQHESVHMRCSHQVCRAQPRISVASPCKNPHGYMQGTRGNPRSCQGNSESWLKVSPWIQEDQICLPKLPTAYVQNDSQTLPTFPSIRFPDTGAALGALHRQPHARRRDLPSQSAQSRAHVQGSGLSRHDVAAPAILMVTIGSKSMIWLT